MFKIMLALLLTINVLSAEEKNSPSTKQETTITQESLKRDVTETSHEMKINGASVHYKAIAGNFLLKNDQNNPSASLYYIAYFRDDVKEPQNRPIIFCFNGGPGSSSVWLHMGVFGPRRVVINEAGSDAPPYEVVDNEYSILDLADLVFIDPVSTGYSRAVTEEEAKQFHGVDADIESIGEFIRQFITYYEKWNSPKLLAGESYGTTRAAGLANHLHDQLNINLNGILLISSILNFQTINDYEKGNDLPYPLFLPTYTATAWYHKKLKDDGKQKDLDQWLAEAKQFAMTEYTTALMKGDDLDEQEYRKTVQKLAFYTGLSEDYIQRSNLRINPQRYTKELLRAEGKVIGRFDTRIVGDTIDATCDYPSYDPSFESISGAFAAAFNQYAREDLKIKNDQEYKILTNLVSSWNYNRFANRFLNMSAPLREVMIKNKALKIFVGSGYFDLATPYFTADYTFDHFNLVPSLRNHISRYYYPAGHMMYTQKASLIKMKNDIANWMVDLKKDTKD